MRFVVLAVLLCGCVDRCEIRKTVQEEIATELARTAEPTLAVDPRLTPESLRLNLDAHAVILGDLSTKDAAHDQQIASLQELVNAPRDNSELDDLRAHVDEVMKIQADEIAEIRKKLAEKPVEAAAKTAPQSAGRWETRCVNGRCYQYWIAN